MRLAGCALALMLLLQPAVAQAPLKIGFVSTFSGPQGQLGEEIHGRDARGADLDRAGVGFY